MRTRCLAVLVLLSGCRQILGLHPLEDDAAGGDVGGEGNGAICVGDTLHTPTGDTACTWGCVPDGGAHCGVPQPAGGGVTANDLADDPQLMQIDLNNAIVDGDTGTISNVRDAGGTGVVNGIGYAVNGNVAVFRFAGLVVHGTLLFRGSHPIALVSTNSIAIDGDLDAAARVTIPGPGGAPGGPERMAALGPGGGNPGQGTDDGSGGSGGGYAADGGAGGLGALNLTAATPGAAFGDPAIPILAGGGGGGGGGGNNANAGGAGGGGLQLVAQAIQITGTIEAGGGGGRHGGVSAGGAGGGAGGTILIEALMIQLGSTCILAVNGGGGGGGGSSLSGGSDGKDGQLGIAAASGGGGSGDGGDGGAAGAVPGQAGSSGLAGGGGGGGVGRIRVNTRNGHAQVDPAAITSPQLGSTAATQGHLAIQ